jgi:hypothetical protein
MGLRQHRTGRPHLGAEAFHMLIPVRIRFYATLEIYARDLLLVTIDPRANALRAYLAFGPFSIVRFLDCIRETL